jgi:hypothetical protein
MSDALHSGNISLSSTDTSFLGSGILLLLKLLKSIHKVYFSHIKPPSYGHPYLQMRSSPTLTFK